MIKLVFSEESSKRISSFEGTAFKIQPRDQEEDFAVMVGLLNPRINDRIIATINPSSYSINAIEQLEERNICLTFDSNRGRNETYIMPRKVGYVIFLKTEPYRKILIDLNEEHYRALSEKRIKKASPNLLKRLQVSYEISSSDIAELGGLIDYNLNNISDL